MLFWEDAGLWGSSNNIPNDIFATLAQMETNWEPRFPFSYQYQSLSVWFILRVKWSTMYHRGFLSHHKLLLHHPPASASRLPTCGLWSLSPTWIQGTLHVAFLCGPSSSCLARITMPFAMMRASTPWEQKLRCITELHAPKSKPASLSVSHIKTHAYRKEDSNRSSYNTQMTFLCYSFTFLFLYIRQIWQSLHLISTFTRKDKET